ncbi:MAG TPA: substrate-binding domain-containing protein [Usitatibacteraceae bacterium]|nr:substrate-binding domain-containing protein [Usitatibacteraceae bacterium]
MDRLRTALRMLGAMLAMVCMGGFAQASSTLSLATTTSTENSGLLKYLLPAFEEQHAVKVKVIAVGTGQALKLGERGDVDVVLVHAREDEDRFVAAGFGVERKDVMYNDFVIVGPKEDPAGIRGLRDIAVALKRLHERSATFISRGDESGTHIMERRLWNEERIVPGGKNYLSAGQGMGAVLTMAGAIGAYTLTDRGTFVAYKARTGLEILVAGDPRLSNPYGVIVVNPARHPHVNVRAARALAEWLVSAQTAQRIRGFRVNGEQLFFPGVPIWDKQAAGR